MDQELLTLPKHPSSPQYLWGSCCLYYMQYYVVVVMCCTLRFPRKTVCLSLLPFACKELMFYLLFVFLYACVCPTRLFDLQFSV